MTMITRWSNLKQLEGRGEQISWAVLFDEFSTPRVFKGDEEQPGWSPAVFEPCLRRRANVVEISAACLDYDSGETLDAVAAAWASAFGFIHTTRGHTLEKPRLRAILPWSRPVSASEHEKLWLALQTHTGGKADPVSRDPARFWYEPGAHDLQFFETRLLKGKILNPDKWLKHV